jgi:hypothetical protein
MNRSDRDGLPRSMREPIRSFATRPIASVTLHFDGAEDQRLPWRVSWSGVGDPLAVGNAWSSRLDGPRGREAPCASTKHIRSLAAIPRDLAPVTACLCSPRFWC